MYTIAQNIVDIYKSLASLLVAAEKFSVHTKTSKERSVFKFRDGSSIEVAYPNIIVH